VGQEQRLQPGIVVRAEREQHLLTDLLGRDGAPGVDVTVLVLVDAPLRAAAVEPTILIRLAVAVAVHLAVDLDAVLVEGPGIDLVVAVGVGEATNGTVLVAEQPARAGARLDQLDLAVLVLLGRRRGAVDARLARGAAKELSLRRR